MIFNKTEQQERDYLKLILNKIRDVLKDVDSSVKEHIETLKEHKEYIWSNKDIDPQEIRSMRESILNHFSLGENVIGRRKRLSKLSDTPYFGRIDFSQNNGDDKAEAIYIGIHTFYDYKKNAILIYDWRSPVSSLFYDYELGPASYSSPSGEVSGHISLKRQYRICKGEMEYMIESSLMIHDEILQRELSSATDEKMKNIVATIQREQNRIVRNDISPTLIIQGVAGSGKTSIALHRIAYLLYTYKSRLSAKDLLILSPNRVFADYISGVLPELGEETVPETGMEQILSAVLKDKYRYQSNFEQMAELFGTPHPGYIERIRYKASFGFITQLDAFILHIENTYFRPADVKLTRNVTIPAGFIEEQFRRFHRCPMRQRYEVMTDYILDMAQSEYRITVNADNRRLLRKAIRNMFAGNDDLTVYKDFFRWIGKPGMFRLRKNRTLEYADLAPLSYLHLALEGNNAQTQVKHLLIDEMQDYSPIQYKVIRKLFSCRKTILGDALQSVNPYGSSDAWMIKNAFGEGEIMKLDKSYRSTCEITAFAKRIRPDFESDMIERHGEQPRIYQYTNIEEEINALSGFISSFRKSSFRSLGIICKEETRAYSLYECLKQDTNDIHFISQFSNSFASGIIITTALMAKGLEFDEVIIPHADSSYYKTEIDKSMLYVAVTRAMHRLSLTCSGAVPVFLQS